MPDIVQEQTQKNLVSFLSETEEILDKIYDAIVSLPQPETSSVPLPINDDTRIRRLKRIHRHAVGKLNEVKARIGKRLWWWQRKALEQVGLYGDILADKLDYLWDSFREGLLKPILKMLNNLLGSLSKVFPQLHAVKEAKDTMEFVIDLLGSSEEMLRVTPKSVQSVR